VASELVMPEKHMLCDQLRDGAREAGLKVATGVVDDPDEPRPPARFDPYRLASNRPSVLLGAIHEDA
jgi:hypothetical protein